MTNRTTIAAVETASPSTDSTPRIRFRPRKTPEIVPNRFDDCAGRTRNGYLAIGETGRVREFVFTVEYERGHDPVMDVFIDHPAMVSKTLACAVTPESNWRLDRITGPDEGLSALDGPFLDPDHCNECLGSHACGATQHYEVLARGPTERTVYAHQTEIEGCHSIPYLASRSLGDGLFYAAERRGHRYEWRILLPDDGRVGGLYDAIQAELGDGLRVDLTHLGVPTHWGDEAVCATELPYEQRAALECAVEAGYYETPRTTTLEALAEEHGLARSTLQYRLRRAEAWLTENFVAECL
jgi:hypothetical protein